MKKRLLTLLASLLSLSLFSACASIPPNVRVYIPISQNCGHFFYTISDEEGDLCGQEWFNIRNTSVVIPTDSYAKIRIYILETCKQNDTCVSIQKKIDKYLTN